mmetsp:Transcript_90043/g.233538  ORF Transcript_90043/g.233538 Transcript_90043/m.233538 type:complete len:246 (+) Transcript_90043:483-1220(+)
MCGQPRLRDGEQTREEFAFVLPVCEMHPQDRVEHYYEGPAADDRKHGRQVRHRGVGIRTAAPDVLGGLIEKPHSPVVWHAILVDEAEVEDQPAEAWPVDANGVAVAAAMGGLHPQVGDKREEEDLAARQHPFGTGAHPPQPIREVAARLVVVMPVRPLLLLANLQRQQIAVMDAEGEVFVEVGHLREEDLELAALDVGHAVLLGGVEGLEDLALAVHAELHILLYGLGSEEVCLRTLLLRATARS